MRRPQNQGAYVQEHSLADFSASECMRFHPENLPLTYSVLVNEILHELGNDRGKRAAKRYLAMKSTACSAQIMIRPGKEIAGDYGLMISDD